MTVDYVSFFCQTNIYRFLLYGVGNTVPLHHLFVFVLNCLGSVCVKSVCGFACIWNVQACGAVRLGLWRTAPGDRNSVIH